MSLLLAIHSWSGANEIMARHYPYFLNAGATRIVGIGTDNHLTKFPEGMEVVEIGDDKYLNGDNVVRRLLYTLDWMLTQPETHFCIAEYDSVFLRKIPEFSGIGGHLAGFSVWGSKAKCFYHNPWFFDRDFGYALRNEIAKILSEGHCGYGTPESSPDVTFGWASERLGIKVQQVLHEYSRNSLDTQEYLEGP